MKFNYQARTRTGEVQSGVVEASNKEAAIDVLKSRELYVTALEEAVLPLYAKKVRLFEKATKKDITLFSRQLAIMFKSRIPLVETLKTLAMQAEKEGFREKILKISEEVEGGAPLSLALSHVPEYFSVFYISMVKAGEASGKLSDVFIYLADYMEKEYHFTSRLKAALMYPFLVIFVFIVVTSIIIGYVIPQLAAVVKELNQDPPWITKIMLSMADFLKTQGLFIALIVLFLILIAYQFSKTKEGKAFFGKLFLDIPILNSFLRKVYLTRFSLNLSTLISGGLPIVKALDVTSEVVGNARYKNIIAKTKEEVRKGGTICYKLEKNPREITPFFYQMVAVGEKTGTLDSCLMNVADFYQKELDRALDDFIKLLEPILIIVLGVFVGLLFAAVLIPIYSIALSY